MRRAGTVVRLAQGVLVVECDDAYPADIGETVVDENLDEIGRVVDVFGPVQRPYIVVSPSDDVHPPTLLGDALYLR